MATIKDVAKEAGVAVETVSRVMNNRGYISEKTRTKVQNAMKSLGYTPNTFAQGLSKKNMDVVAVIVPGVSHPYFSAIVNHLENEASARGYKVFLYESGGNIKKESQALKICQSSFVSGALLFSSDIPSSFLEKLDIPVALVERNPVGNTISIQCDNPAGGRLAADHLIERGCKRMLVISTANKIDMPGDLRETAFVDRCREAGFSVNAYDAPFDDFITMDYTNFISKALDSVPDCDGIFATSDLIAAQVIQVCSKRGKRIPDDIKLVGFDDVLLASLTTPRLTTVKQPISEIASQAIDAIEALHDGIVTPRSVKLPVSLVIRDST